MSLAVDHRHKRPEVGALVLLDAYQSVGITEIDVTARPADFLPDGSIQWLCGGPACGYLYVRPDLIETLEPRPARGTAHAGVFGFEHGPIRYDDTVRRFA